MQTNARLALVRAVGLAEGCSFLLLLFVAMPLKYLADLPQFVRYIGSLHGALWVIYIILAVVLGLSLRWKISRIALALVCSVLPFGPFFFDAQLRKNAT